MSDSKYNVVFRHTEGAGAYAGVINWSTFNDKDHFDEWMKEAAPTDQEVIAENVSEEEAVRLTLTTPLLSHIAVATEEATDPKTGFDPQIFNLKMLGIMLAIA